MEKLQGTIELMKVTVNELAKSYLGRNADFPKFNREEKVILMSAPSPKIGYGSHYTLFAEMEIGHDTFDDLVNDFWQTVTYAYEDIIEVQKAKLDKIEEIIKAGVK